MRFTEEMIAEDEKRWHDRNVVTELGFCSNYMPDRKSVTNLDIRFYAFIMRKACEVLKAQEPVEPYTERDGRTTFFLCGSCNKPLCIAKDSYKPKCCPECGRKVKWE